MITKHSSPTPSSLLVSGTKLVLIQTHEIGERKVDIEFSGRGGGGGGLAGP